MSRDLIGKVRRGIRKPPHVIARRAWDELRAEAARFTAPHRGRRFDGAALLAATDARTVADLWNRLAARPFPAWTVAVDRDQYERLCPGDVDRILNHAESVVERRVNLLGTGPIALGTPIDWHRDYKTDLTWPVIYMRDIDYCNPDRPSDVKVPWEISRGQWMIAAGQAYLLTGEERYAAAVRDILDDWIGANPYAYGVNWACTLEPAMRVLSWTWFFHVFHGTQAWRDAEFRDRFLRTLYLHGEFVDRHIERSDLNGNHFTADACAMVCCGLFFGDAAAPRAWANAGWSALVDELPLQVLPDGVDFEGSIAYHRFVMELFFLAARYRQTCGLPVSDAYEKRVKAMARFAMAYSRPDGTVPLIGDADDARALPFGGQDVNDHRYLAGQVAACWGAPEFRAGFSGSLAEVVWAAGPDAAASLRDRGGAGSPPASTAFPDGGYFVMRNNTDHVFVDCGPVGQRGRGGHGHNDCLSFEAVLDGTPIVTDCGAYVYTASYGERNAFRSTSYHNTPQVDDQEINRFVDPAYLWMLQNDAHPELRTWSTGSDRDVLRGSHSGYQRLTEPVTPVRTITLDHGAHALSIEDAFEGTGTHRISTPLHLAPGVSVASVGDGLIHLQARGKAFTIRWSPSDDWQVTVLPARVSPSYGVLQPSHRIVWSRTGPIPAFLHVDIAPAVSNRPGSDDVADAVSSSAFR